MNNLDQRAVCAIRALSIDAIQKAKSGHPGIALGAAPAAFAVWKHMAHNPADPRWANRDRFVLSAGHGSALLYSLLHLFGYGVTVEDMKNFRQLGSLTPGHPEYGHTVGIETTTGPLGQGIANAVGFAMAETHLAAMYNRPGYEIVDHYTYVLCGDGCLMEGISGEASSLAGTLKLGKLILLYDCNHISIEGDTAGAFTEDVAARYAAYHWQVLDVADGNDTDAIAKALEEARACTDQPTIVIVHTKIGAFSPKEGSASSHGEPLGADNVTATKKAMGWPEEDFYVPRDVYDGMEAWKAEAAQKEAAWDALFAEYTKAYPELAEAFRHPQIPDFSDDAAYWPAHDAAATRNAGGACLNHIAKQVPQLFGGSADLAPSNKSDIKGEPYYSPENRAGRNLHFGVREHAMGAICNGIALHGGLVTYAATFLVFSDYMKHAMRLAAMMKLPVTYILTHDSIGVGEDGPTHQPIEHLAMLRSIPGMTVFRPADATETAAAWNFALHHKGPTALALSRQNLASNGDAGRQAVKGAYVLKDAPDARLILLATGSEVELAVKAWEKLQQEGIAARVVSMPSWEVFDAQDAQYKESVLPGKIRARLGIEAASPMGWGKYLGLDGDLLCMEGFGASGPAGQVFEHFGFTVDNVVARAKALLK